MQQLHEFAVSGCRWQWDLKHDHAECWRAFMVHNGLPENTTYEEFYARDAVVPQ